MCWEILQNQNGHKRDQSDITQQYSKLKILSAMAKGVKGSS